MAVYVDDMLMFAQVGRIRARWSHMEADSVEELHAFAARLGMKLSWFQGPPKHRVPHYDVTESVREKAIALGAIPQTMRAGSERRRALAATHLKGKGNYPTTVEKDQNEPAWKAGKGESK